MHPTLSCICNKVTSRIQTGIFSKANHVILPGLKADLQTSWQGSQSIMINDGNLSPDILHRRPGSPGASHNLALRCAYLSITANPYFWCVCMKKRLGVLAKSSAFLCKRIFDHSGDKQALPLEMCIIHVIADLQHHLQVAHFGMMDR